MSRSDSSTEPGGPPGAALVALLKKRLGDEAGAYRLPPPVMEHMHAEIVAFDEEKGTLTARFPILEGYLNPYGAVQGGMIAAAVDNTLGPLSMMVAPPNVTRHLEMTYSRPVTLDMEHIVVHGRLVDRDDRQLRFAAEVSTRDGVRIARARATHWIVHQITV
jgi:acyl-coenzyme A thioesterase PaaI-like protein